MKDLLNNILKYSFQGRITKKTFEAMLDEQFGKGNVNSEDVKEEFTDPYGEEITERLTAYYVNGKHVGSFLKGEGFIYSDTYQKPKYLTSLAY